MKKYYTILLITTLLFACKEDAKSDQNRALDKDKIEVSENSNPKTIPTSSENDRSMEMDSEMETMNEDSNEEAMAESDTKMVSAKDYTGSFQRSDDEKTLENCDCNCVNVSLTDVSMLCVDKESNINIKIKFKKSSTSDLDIYYVSGSGKLKGLEKEIPWEDFDTTAPLATINFTDSDNFKMDWKGFMQNGEIAMDYAVLGKKNLEGSYKRK
jgi:hypothetical protein